MFFKQARIWFPRNPTNGHVFQTSCRFLWVPENPPGASLILVDDIHCAYFGHGVSHNSPVLRFTVTFRLALALEEPITVPPAVSAHAIGFVASGFLDGIWIPKKQLPRSLA